jgi:hypothetical protein
VIDPSEFKHVWDQLCVRFGQTNDAEAAAAYLEYLTDQMETGQFIQAARALWATNRWFPRPADFVLVGAAREWKLVIQAAEAYVPPNWSWQTPWSQLSKRAQEACKALGGMTTVRTLWEKDVSKLKHEWERAYEQEAAAEVLALPAVPMRQLGRV